MDEYKIYFEKFKNAILLFIFGIVLFVFLLSKLMPSVQAIFRDNKTYKTQNDKTYDLKNNIVYYIGSELLERIYLILHLEDGVVSGYTYGVKT